MRLTGGSRPIKYLTRPPDSGAIFVGWPQAAPISGWSSRMSTAATAGKAGKKTLLLLVRSKEGVRYTVVDLAQ